MAHPPQSPFDVREGIRRGRPPLLMTPQRRLVLAKLAELAIAGEKVTMAELARRCGLYDYRQARRIVKDLQKMGVVA